MMMKRNMSLICVICRCDSDEANDDNVLLSGAGYDEVDDCDNHSHCIDLHDYIHCDDRDKEIKLLEYVLTVLYRRTD